ncbi:hypothetical protein MMC11_006225 [Xylographa trunciseda]|nr:hypothetical protein [Xylographa trunciseda]
MSTTTKKDSSFPTHVRSTIIAESHSSVRYICHWDASTVLTSGLGNTFRTVNVYIRETNAAVGATDSSVDELIMNDRKDHVLSKQARIALDYLVSSIRRLLLVDFVAEAGLKFILPCSNGYVVRSDFLRKRMVGCEVAESFLEFVDTECYVRAINPTTFTDVLDHAVGAVVTRQAAKENLRSDMKRLQEELVARISFPWIISSRLTHNRLVVVGSRHQLVMAAWFESAYQLGIQITLIGPHGHFLQHNWALYPAVEQYLAINMKVDDDLSSRIIKALADNDRPFHGITTFKDPYLVPVAKVAGELNLTTAPLEAVSTCIDKHLTRTVVQNASGALRVPSLVDLKDRMGKTPLKYPLIVKPCAGYGSEGVFKVTSDAELFKAVTTLESAPEKVDILVDTYIDGPEIDANFVLYDGEILFYELVDGLPCTAEYENFTGGNFLETDQMWPSNHPVRESNLLRKELHAILLQLGFRTGVLHVEARIQNSAMHYTVEHGLQDLRPHNKPLEADPSYVLMEINQRPPGHGGFSSTRQTYGIDYMALYSLCALGAKERVQALSQPFAYTGGAQCWTDSIFLNADKAGIYNGGDIPAQLQTLRPDLMAYVCFSACYYKYGDVVLDDPPRIALVIVSSKVSRQHVREVAQQVRVVAQSLVKMR